MWCISYTTFTLPGRKKAAAETNVKQGVPKPNEAAAPTVNKLCHCI